MHIMLAVHHYPPRYLAGAEKSTQLLAQGLSARGHDVRVVCVEHIDRGPIDGVAYQDEVYEGIHVRRMSFDLSAAPDRDRWEYDNPWIGLHLREYIAQFRPEVFHLIGGYLLSGSALRAAYGAGVPTVVTLTDFWYLCPRITLIRTDGNLSSAPIDPARCARCIGEQRRRYRIPRRLFPAMMQAYWRLRKDRVRAIETRARELAATLQAADAVISPSRFLRGVYQEAGIRIDRFEVIPHGTSLGSDMGGPRRDADLAGLRVGYVGQIAWHKGVHVLIESARRIADPRLQVVVYGDLARFPDYAARLRSMVRGDPRIRFMGTYKGEQEAASILRGLDVLVVPSVWYENCPRVILEAFACRTPVLATDLGGMAEMVVHGTNGMLFERGDARGLARQLQRLLDEPGLLAELRSGLAAVRTEEEEVAEIETIYSEICLKRDAHFARA